MQLISALALTLSCIFCFSIPFCVGKPRHQLHHETPDIGKVFEAFPHGVAIFDMDKDGDLDCVAALRTDYDRSAPRATYVWMLPGINGREPRNISFPVVPGAKPGTFRFWDKNGDGTVENGRYIYTDYKDCVIMYLHEREECMLWTSRDMKDAVPQTCMDQYEDNCDGAHKSYDEETCSPFFNV